MKLDRPKLAGLGPGGHLVLMPSGQYEAAAYADQDVSAGDAKRATFDGCLLERVDLTSAALRAAGLVDVRFDGCELAAADLTESALTRVELGGSRLTGAIMAASRWRHVTVRNCKLNLLNFRTAQLTRVRFDGCDLSEADFGGAVMREVTFAGCDLRATDWSGASLIGVDLRGAQLSDLAGVTGLRGATISSEQLMAIAGTLASGYGLEVE